MRNPKVGLLPLYVELYDSSLPELRPRIEGYLSEILVALEDSGLEVVTAPVCRLEGEISSAVGRFEDEEADAIVTLHLAYSPSLEAERVLARTSLPLIMLDSTPAPSFNGGTDSSELMFNHGIHGVQDLCNRLVRREKPFVLHAGHHVESDVLLRLKQSARAAMLAKELRSSRVGLVGTSFPGMGDFLVEFAELRDELGVTVVAMDEEAPRPSDVPAADVIAEMELDQTLFEISEGLSRSTHEDSTRTGLALRSWIERESLTALSINFMASSKSHEQLPVMPFVECSKAMSRGIGYAGEGDVLTAAWVGALLQVFPETTFTEMFCPDWSGESVFLSHMGEFNYRIAHGRPRLTTLDFPYTDADDPTVALGTFQEGAAILANLAPYGSGRYGLTLATGRMRVPEGENRLATLINGWFVPDSGLVPFLEAFSQRGATHHSALIYAEPSDVQILVSLARFLSCDVEVV